MTQLTFSLPHRSAMGAEDFIVTESNRLAVAQLDKWPHWPARVLVLQGAAGSGKTHLAQIWAQKSQAVMIASGKLAANLPALLQHQHIVVENTDALYGDEVGEQALFHLCNHAMQGGAMLLTVATPPAAATIQLPDLRSRLRAYPLLSLAPPDDALLAALLVKQFSDRQLRVGQEVVDYLLPRIERSAAAAAAIVQALDETALTRRQAVTVPLVRAVLEAKQGLLF